MKNRCSSTGRIKNNSIKNLIMKCQWIFFASFFTLYTMRVICVCICIYLYKKPSSYRMLLKHQQWCIERDINKEKCKFIAFTFGLLTFQFDCKNVISFFLCLTLFYTLLYIFFLFFNLTRYYTYILYQHSITNYLYFFFTKMAWAWWFSFSHTHSLLIDLWLLVFINMKWLFLNLLPFVRF
jgi:hypothetical protein